MTSSKMRGPDCLLIYCRPGFEKESASEIVQVALELGFSGYAKTQAEQGFVLFYLHEADELTPFMRMLQFDSLVFARQLVFAAELLTDLPVKNRIEPLLVKVMSLAPFYSELLLETADTNEAKSLSAFIRKFAAPFRAALNEKGLLKPDTNHPKLHVFFLTATSGYVGLSLVDNSSPWPMGIPRLKFPRGAPSRSTLKLDEAFGQFVSSPDHDLSPGMTAVDLGAAPGGWTFQLVRRHIRTIAVDNGKLDPSLLDSGIVQHVRADGFKYRPLKPVDWMVCDMIEQPFRIATLVGDWLKDGHCRYVIFNLKLPMKKRYEAAGDCRRIIEEKLAGSGRRYHIAFKQLYHDRAEITGYVSLLR